LTILVISPAGFSGKGLLAAGARQGEENPLTQQAGNQVRVKTVCLQKEIMPWQTTRRKPMRETEAE
jgi:hypothetical protein